MSLDGPSPPARQSAGLVLALVGALSSAAVVPEQWGVAPAVAACGLTIYAWRFEHRCARALGTVVTATLGLLAIPGVWPTWPLPLFIALAVYGALIRFDQFDPPMAWWRRGTLERGGLVLAGAFAAAASIALVLWWQLASPDLTELHDRLPRNPLLLVAGGLAFSMANALAEEAMWRGLVSHALLRTLGRPSVVLVVQAASFGLVHYGGFPRGMIGVGLAAVYGLMMGVLRARSNGLLLPWLAHVAADLTIVSVVAFLAYD